MRDNTAKLFTNLYYIDPNYMYYVLSTYHCGIDINIGAQLQKIYFLPKSI